MSTVRSDLDTLDPEWPWPLDLVVDTRARRLKLRLDIRRRRVVLTCPPRASRRQAIDWALGQRDWAMRQIAQVPAREPIEPGGTLPMGGREVRLEWKESAARTPQLDGDVLSCGGPAECFEKRILRWLRAHALDCLAERTAEIALRAGVSVTKVSVGDADTRWGSCSSDGAIRYNWRLLMAPSHVLDWVVAHEVAHRAHMNHGPAFKKLEKSLYEGDPEAARSELRRISARLKGIGRGV